MYRQMIQLAFELERWLTLQLQTETIEDDAICRQRREVFFINF